MDGYDLNQELAWQLREMTKQMEFLAIENEQLREDITSRNHGYKTNTCSLPYGYDVGSYEQNHGRMDSHDAYNELDWHFGRVTRQVEF